MLGGKAPTIIKLKKPKQDKWRRIEKALFIRWVETKNKKNKQISVVLYPYIGWATWVVGRRLSLSGPYAFIFIHKAPLIIE